MGYATTLSEHKRVKHQCIILKNLDLIFSIYLDLKIC